MSDRHWFFAYAMLLLAAIADIRHFRQLRHIRYAIAAEPFISDITLLRAVITPPLPAAELICLLLFFAYYAATLLRYIISMSSSAAASPAGQFAAAAIRQPRHAFDTPLFHAPLRLHTPSAAIYAFAYMLLTLYTACHSHTYTLRCCCAILAAMLLPYAYAAYAISPYRVLYIASILPYMPSPQEDCQLMLSASCHGMPHAMPRHAAMAATVCMPRH